MAEIFTLQRFDKLASNSYILHSGEDAAVIDPSVPYERAMELFLKTAPRVRYVILTHAHADHFWEIESYTERGAEVIVSSADKPLLSDGRGNCAYFIGYDLSYSGPCKTVDEGDVISLGDTELHVMMTPGHTAGSAVYYTDGFAFVGDTVFERGGYGRTDLPTGDSAVMPRSIKRVLSLPEDTVLYPGHGEPFSVKCAKTYF